MAESLSTIPGVSFRSRNRNAFSLYSVFYYVYRFGSRRRENGDNLSYCRRGPAFLHDIYGDGEVNYDNGAEVIPSVCGLVGWFLGKERG